VDGRTQDGTQDYAAQGNSGQPQDSNLRGGVLIFNEYGQLKYHIPDRLEDLERDRQVERLKCLAESGFFEETAEPRPATGSQSRFADLHRARAMR
jgi:hypothetical protein